MTDNYEPSTYLMPSSMPYPGVFKTFISGHERFGQEDAYFNSELTTRDGFQGNASLTIHLRLHLFKRDRPNEISPRAVLENGKDVDIVPWGEATESGEAYDFAAYARAARTQAENFWDNTNLCLIPPADYRGLEYSSGGQTYRPNIECRFKIRAADGVNDAHAVITCICPKKKHEFRSHVRHSATAAQTGQWTCYDLALDTGDIIIRNGKTCEVPTGDPLVSTKMKTVRCDKLPAQEAVCHEVGHLLGLSHVGKFFKMPDCLKETADTGRSNSLVCYRGPTDEATENIMGGGMKLATWNIRPWASRVISHTGIGLQGWRASLTKQPPRRI